MLYGISEQYPNDIETYLFNHLLDLIYDQYYPLYAKIKICFAFVLVIVNPIIFD